MTFYRPANEDDRRFVIASWASSYKNAHHAGMIASEDWPAVMHRQIEKLIDRPSSRTIVAYEAAASDFLYGFVAGDVSGSIPVLYYVYVKGPYRSQEAAAGRSGPRHARGLLEAIGIDPARPFLYTCRTAIVARLGDKIPRGRFTPAAARYTNHQELRDDHR